MTRARCGTAVAVALLMAMSIGCSTSNDDNSTGSSTSTTHADLGETAVVRAGQPVEIGDLTLTRDDGDPVTLRVDEVAEPAAPIEASEPVSEPVSLTEESDFDGTITLTWAVPADQVATTFVAYDAGDGWVPVETIADLDAATVTATTDHFSAWGTFSTPVWGTVQTIAGTVRDVLGLGEIGEPPDCDDPIDGTVTISAPDGEDLRVEACAMERDGKLTVRLSNRRAITMKARLPDGVTRTGGAIYGLGEYVTAAVDRINESLSDRDDVIIPSGGWTEFTWDTWPTGETVLELSGDNSGVVYSTMFAFAGTNPGTWEKVGDLLETGELLTAIANMDLHSALRIVLTELLETTGAVATALVGVVVGSVIGGVRGILDSFRPLHGTASVQAVREDDTPTPADGALPTDFEDWLEAFAAAWVNGEDLSRWGPPEAVSTVPELPPGDYEVDVQFDPATCRGGSSGAGGCTVVLRPTVGCCETAYSVSVNFRAVELPDGSLSDRIELWTVSRR